MKTAAATAEQAVIQEEPVEKPRPYLKLYEATDAIDIVREWLVESEGELTPEIEALLNDAHDDFDAKVERVALLAEEKGANADAAEATAKAIEEVAMRHRLRARVERNGVATLKEYLKREMTAADRLKVERPLARVRVQKNSAPAVKSTLDEHAIEQLFTKASPFAVRTVTFSLDSKAVVAAAKREETLPNGIVVEYGTHVRIY